MDPVAHILIPACQAAAGLTGIACALQLWQVVAGFLFPLHRRLPANSFHPPISLLKPVKDADPDLERCLRSWLHQDYPGPVECLIGVGSPEDPACPVIRRLITEHPDKDVHLVLCPDRTGPNAKASKLAHLESLAHHPVVVISDADVLAPKDLLRQVVAPLEQDRNGLVTCLYRLAEPATPALRCEAIGVNADFWAQVLMSRFLREQDFALGAVMAIRATDLHSVGGFSSLVHHLADDYHLGRRVHALGRRIVLAQVPVDCWDPPAGWRAAWQHQLRWNRTIRVCQPAPYLASILANVTLWAVLFLALSTALQRPPWAGIAALGLRFLTAQFLQSRMFPGQSRRPGPWWIWIKDLQAALLWAAAFLGNTVVWRRERFIVKPDGRLVRTP